MSSEASAPTARLWKATYYTLLALLCVLVVGSFVRRGINFSPVASFQDMVDGTAHRPFVQRALVPLLIRLLSDWVPEAVRQAVDQYVRNPLISLQLVKSMRLLQVDWTQLLVAMSIWWASLVGFAVVLKRLARCFYAVNEGFLDVLSLAAIAGVPTFFRYYSYLYDLTHLFLFTACLLLLARARWAFYIPLFAVACVSKETSVLLVGVFAVYYFRSLAPARFGSLLCLHLIVFGLIRLLLGGAFADNPGSEVELHMLDHNLWLWPYEVSQFVAFCAIGIAVARGWSDKPRFLRLSFALILPVLVGLTLALGYVDEYRDYYEAYAVMLLLVAPSVAELAGVRPFERLDE